MTNLIVAVLAFMASHAIPSLKPLRGALVARLGERTFRILYSLLSLAMIVWLIWAYIEAPYVELWAYRPWMAWVPVLVMPFACLLFVCALTAPNPLSISASRAAYDPTRPGIVSVTRHPLMGAFGLWAGAHVVPNGDAASLILFGLLFALSLAGPPSLDAKRRSTLGMDAWQRLAGPTSTLPLAAVLAGRTRLDVAGIGAGRIIAALALYGLLLLAHPWVIGVSPLPF
jgi:uncharacterized membrane protein